MSLVLDAVKTDTKYLDCRSYVTSAADGVGDSGVPINAFIYHKMPHVKQLYTDMHIIYQIIALYVNPNNIVSITIAPIDS